AADELRRVGRVVDDVDLLPAELLHDRLHARPAHADAGPDRVDVAVVRHDGDLRAAARLAHGRLHLDDALVDLRHLLTEELDQEVRVRPREDDLRTLRGQVDVVDVRADAIALAVALGQDRVGAAEVHDDVLLLEALHDAREDLALPVLELVVDQLALGVADLLDDVLLRGLCRDAAEHLARQLGEQLVSDVGLLVVVLARVLERELVLGVRDLVDDLLDLEELDLADLEVVLRLDHAVEPEVA